MRPLRVLLARVAPPVLAAIFVVAFASASLAEPVATILLASGVRLTGEFHVIRDGELHLREEPAEDRRVPVAGVVLVDFDGTARDLPAAEIEAAGQPGDLLVLRDGTLYAGELESVVREGELRDRPIADAPIMIVFRASDGSQHSVDVEQVARLYLGRAQDLASMDGVLATDRATPAPPR